MDIHFTTQVFKEGRTFVAHTPQLDVSSCGNTKERAVKSLREAVRLFLEEAGYLKKKSGSSGPVLVGPQELPLPLPQHGEP